jgi:hypothetical protein
MNMWSLDNLKALDEVVSREAGGSFAGSSASALAIRDEDAQFPLLKE